MEVQRIYIKPVSISIDDVHLIFQKICVSKSIYDLFSRKSIYDLFSIEGKANNETTLSQFHWKSIRRIGFHNKYRHQ